MVAAVAAVDPDIAANAAQVAMFACMRPPGSQRNQAVKQRYMRSVRPPRSSSSPMRMNIGTATSTFVVPTFHAIRPVISHSGRSLKKVISPSAMTPRTAATCTPAK